MRTEAGLLEMVLIYWVSVMADRMPMIGQDLNAVCLKLRKQLTIIATVGRS